MGSDDGTSEDDEFGLDPEFDPGDRDHDSSSFEGAEVLRAGGPARVLDRLLRGDPLGLERETRVRLRKEGWMLPAELLLLRSMARIAYAAHGYRGKPPLACWIDARIAQAAEELIEEQLAEELHHVPLEDSRQRELFRRVSDELGLPPERCRLVCLTINRMEAATRRVLRGVAVDGKELAELAHEASEPLEVVQRRLRDALLGIYAALEGGHDEEGDPS